MTDLSLVIDTASLKKVETEGRSAAAAVRDLEASTDKLNTTLGRTTGASDQAAAGIGKVTEATKAEAGATQQSAATKTQAATATSAFAKSVEALSKTQDDAKKATASASESFRSQVADIEALMRSYKTFQQAVAALEKQFKAGFLNETGMARSMEALEAAFARTDKAGKEMTKTNETVAGGFKLTGQQAVIAQAAVSNFASQVMASGQVMTATMNQLPVLIQTFGFAAILNPTVIALAAFGGALVAGTAAAETHERALRRLQNTLQPMGDQFKALTTEIDKQAIAAARMSDFGVQAFRDLQAEIIKTGNAGGVALADLTRVADNLAHTLGVDLEKATGTLAQVFESPTAAAKRLASQGFAGINFEAQRSIELLQQSGRSAEASAVLFQLLDKATADAARNVTPLQAAIRDLKNAFGDLLRNLEPVGNLFLDMVAKVVKGVAIFTNAINALTDMVKVVLYVKEAFRVAAEEGISFAEAMDRYTDSLMKAREQSTAVVADSAAQRKEMSELALQLDTVRARREALTAQAEGFREALKIPDLTAKEQRDYAEALTRVGLQLQGVRDPIEQYVKGLEDQAAAYQAVAGIAREFAEQDIRNKSLQEQAGRMLTASEAAYQVALLNRIKSGMVNDILRSTELQVSAQTAQTAALEKGGAAVARETNFQRARVEALAYAREGTDRYEQVVAKLAAKYDEFTEAQAKNRAQTTLDQRRDEIALLEKEASLVGQRQEVVARELAMARERVRIFRDGTDADKQMADQLVETAGRQAELNAKLAEFNRIAERTTDALADAFVSAFDNAKGPLDGFKQYFLRTIKEMAAQAVIRPIIAPIVAGTLAPFFGLGGSAQAATSSGGVGGLGMLSNLSSLSNVGSIFNLSTNPLARLGGFASEFAGFGGVSAGTIAGTELGASIASVGGFGAELGAGSAGIAAGISPLAATGIGAAIALPAILGLSGIFGGKKSVGPGGNIWFGTDSTGAYTRTGGAGDNGYDFTSLEPDARKIVGQLNTFAKGFGTTYSGTQGGSIVLGYNAGTKQYESSLGTPTGYQQVGGFAEYADAVSHALMIGIRNADWSKAGDDVASAIKNSAATALDGLQSDAQFGQSFRRAIAVAGATGDAFATQAVQIKAGAEDAGKAMAASITAFLDKAKELYPVAEGVSEQVAAATEAMRKQTLGALGLADTTKPLDGAALSVATLKANLEGLRPALEAVGIVGEEATAKIAEGVKRGIAKLAADFTTTLGQALEAAQGRGYLAQIRSAVAAFTQNVTDAAALGIDKAANSQIQALLEAQLRAIFKDLNAGQLQDVIKSFADGNATIATVAREAADALAAQATATTQVTTNTQALIAAQATLSDAQTGIVARLLNVQGAGKEAELYAFDAAAEKQRKQLQEQLAAAGATGTDYARILAEQLEGALAGERLAITKKYADAQLQVERDTAAEIKQLQAQAAQAQVSFFSQQLASVQAAKAQWDGFAKSLGDFRKSLLVGDFSPLTPLGKFEEAQRQFRDTAAKAKLGDLTAIGDLQGAATAYLQANAGYNASSNPAAFDEVQAALAGTESLAARQANIAQDQLTVLKQQLAVAQAQLDALQGKATTTGAGTGNLLVSQLSTLIDNEFAQLTARAKGLGYNTNDPAVMAQLRSGEGGYSLLGGYGPYSDIMGTAGSQIESLFRVANQGDIQGAIDFAGTVGNQGLVSFIRRLAAARGVGSMPSEVTGRVVDPIPADYQATGRIGEAWNAIGGQGQLGVFGDINYTGPSGADLGRWITANGAAGAFETSVLRRAHDMGIPGFAGGGDAPAGMDIMVGEYRPERIRLKAPAHIYPGSVEPPRGAANDRELLDEMRGLRGDIGRLNQISARGALEVRDAVERGNLIAARLASDTARAKAAPKVVAA